jgi:hypothetical protein
MKKMVEYMYGRTEKEKALLRHLNWYGFLGSMGWWVGSVFYG